MMYSVTPLCADITASMMIATPSANVMNLRARANQSAAVAGEVMAAHLTGLRAGYPSSAFRRERSAASSAVSSASAAGSPSSYMASGTRDAYSAASASATSSGGG